MGGYAAPMSAAGTAGGTALNAYGQNQAANAMHDVWSRQGQIQQQYAGQERAQQAALMNGLQGNVGFNQPAQQAQAAQMGGAAHNVAAAVQALQARKAGGAGGSAMMHAREGDNTSAILGRAGQDANLQSILQAITNGSRNVDMLGRTYDANLGGIRSDEKRRMGTMPIDLQAAGMQGGLARTLGTNLNNAGQIGMMWSMAQPKTPGNAPLSADQAITQQPIGGWAASKTYHNSDGSTGANV